MEKLIQKIKAIDGYKKRGMIYITLAVLMIAYELLFIQPARLIVLLLWFGVIVIGVIVMTTLRENKS